MAEDQEAPMAAHHTPLPQPLFHQPIFSEDDAVPSPTGFKTKHDSDTATYKEVENLLKKAVVPVPKSRADGDAMFSLEDAYGSNHGAAVVGEIKKAGKIVFHAIGDSGASAPRKYTQDELRVSDQVTLDCTEAEDGDRPAFLYHLGDVVYNFGEARYYFDQFYDAFRNYPAPIFAIPGNHDSFVVPGTAEADKPLTTFQRNFCAEQPVITPEAGSLHRTAMTQPGVYFTLDAPYVRIIGLFSNALEDPGVISNEDGKWPTVDNTQLDYLRAQLKRIKTEKYKGAVLLAVHHPPYSYAPPPKKGSGGDHSSSSEMLRQIDEICLDAGIYPHAVLSAHAHNYQRYSRTIEFNGQEYDVPFIVCGDGGHNVNPLVRKGAEPNPTTRVDYLEAKNAKIKAKELWLEKFNYDHYGYLRVHADEKELVIEFHQVGAGTLAQSRYDMVTVNLAGHKMVTN
jgi:hypothetical protein